jgi:hypothetical protein
MTCAPPSLSAAEKSGSRSFTRVPAETGQDGQDTELDTDWGFQSGVCLRVPSHSLKLTSKNASLSAMLPEEPSSGSPHSKSEGNAGAIAKVPSTSATQSRNRKNKKR